MPAFILLEVSSLVRFDYDNEASSEDARDIRELQNYSGLYPVCASSDILSLTDSLSALILSTPLQRRVTSLVY